MDSENWLDKCLMCKHSYTRKDDCDYIYCRCRKGRCNYEPIKKRGKNNEWTQSRRDYLSINKSKA